MGPVVDGVRHAEVVWPKPRILELRGPRLGTSDANPIQADDTWAHLNGRYAPDEVAMREHGLALTTYLEGKVRVELTHEELGTARRDVMLTNEPGTVLVVEDVAFEPGRPGELHVEGAVRNEHGELPTFDLHTDDGRDYAEADEDGIYRSIALRDGTFIRLGAYGEALRGSGPYRLTLPQGSILLEVELAGRDAPDPADDEPASSVDAQVYVDGTVHPDRQQKIGRGDVVDSRGGIGRHPAPVGNEGLHPSVKQGGGEPLPRSGLPRQSDSMGRA